MFHTTQAIAAADTSRQALQPVYVRLGLFEDVGVALLEDFVHGNEGLERLDFVGEDWLPGAWLAVQAAYTNWRRTYTFMPCQKEFEFLWSHV